MSDTIENEILQKISSGYRLPALSSVALRLMETASDEKSSLYDMSAIIEEDPALAIRLLKLANSPFFRISSEVSTIQEAVMRVGYNQLRLMALSISLRDTFPFVKYGPLDYEQFWKSSLYQALLARCVAQNIRTCNPDEAFVAGLVSEIGLLILFDLFIKDKDMEIKLNLYPLGDLINLEEQRYGINHRKVGEAALRFWRLPEIIVECQRFYADSNLDKLSPLASICEISRQCAAFICYEGLDWGSLYQKAEKEFNLKQEILSEIMVETFNTVESVAENMKIKISRESDIGFLAGKAKESLSKLSLMIEASPNKTLPSFQSLKGTNCEPIVKGTLQAVAHEIRNPLTILGGFARRLEKILAPSSKEWGYVQQIIEESKRLETVLSSMTTGKL